MCFWCFQRSFREPEPDWTPQGMAQRRKGVSYEPRRSISETNVITIPSLSRSLANRQGVVDLSAYHNEQRPPTPTRRPRRPSIPIPQSATESPADQQSFGPATAAPSSESAGQEVSLPPSPPLSSPPSPPCMSPTLVEFIQAHISSNPLQVREVRPESILPTKGTPESAGYDLYAAADILIPSATHVLRARACACGGPPLSPWPACPVGAACRGVVGGRPRGGWPSSVVRRVWCRRCPSSGRPSSGVGSRGSATRVSQVRSVRAWGPSTGPRIVRPCGPPLLAVGVAEGRPRGGCFPPFGGASEVRRSPSPDCPPTGRVVGVRHPRAAGAGVWVWGPITVPLACVPCGGCVPRGW